MSPFYDAKAQFEQKKKAFGWFASVNDDDLVILDRLRQQTITSHQVKKTESM